MKFVNETQTLEKHKENNKDENFDLKSCIEKISDEELIERLNNIKEEPFTEIDIIIEEIQKRNIELCYKVKKNNPLFLSLALIGIMIILVYLFIFVIINNISGGIIGIIVVFLLTWACIGNLSFNVYMNKIEIYKNKLIIKNLFNLKEIDFEDIIKLNDKIIGSMGSEVYKLKIIIETKLKKYLFYRIKKESIYIMKKLINK